MFYHFKNGIDWLTFFVIPQFWMNFYEILENNRKNI